MILLLGGTAEARALAELLADRGLEFVSSLAGRVARPRLPVGQVRIGGFGGVAGLVAHLTEHRVELVIDATHPFAEGMSRNAAAACATTGVPLVRLERPGWAAEPGADRWHWVDSHDQAAALTADLGKRPWLTVGRQSLDRFVGPLADHPTLVRVVDPPAIPLPEAWTLLTSRGPYTEAGEAELIERHGADLLVTKDSGGDYTRAKLTVADRLGLPVVVVRRSPGAGGIPSFSEPADLVAHLFG